jgi:hypothetical protein
MSKRNLLALIEVNLVSILMFFASEKKMQKGKIYK